MFSRYSTNDREQKRNENNDRSDIGDSAALVLTSQYIENTNRNYPFFNPQNSINNLNPIFVQSEQMDAYSSEDTSGHEHLMILAAAAVNSSPSNDSCKSGGNSGEQTLIRTAESPHFSIHDPPLIRLSPTSPNNIFRHGIYNEEFSGIVNPIHNTGYSANNVDWLSQELYVKTENAPGELTHSSLKQQSFNNSLSDTEFPAVQSRGRSQLRHTEFRDYDNPQNSSTHLRSRKDLKRKRLYNPENDFDAILNSQHNTPNSVDDYASNLNTSTFINLTESDGEVDDGDTIRNRMTPELPERHYQWWPIKRHCTEPVNDSDAHVEVRDHSHNNSQHDSISSSNVTASPLFDASHITPQLSSRSPPFYMCAGNNADTLGSYQGDPNDITGNSGIINNDVYNDSNSPATDNFSPVPNFMQNPIEFQLEDPVTTSSNVSSYLRHILVPQLRNRRRYGASNLPTSFRDFSRLYLPPSPDRSGTYRTSSQSGIMDSGPYYPRRSSSGSFVHATIYDPEGHNTASHQTHLPITSRLSAAVNNTQDDRNLPSNLPYRRNTIPPSMNTLLRAYGLEEVHQRQEDDPYEQPRDPRVPNDSTTIHPLLRISERNYLNPMLDNRSRSHFSRPFGMYESQGSVESVIQLALHLETSWRGISPEELSRLPCHYYSQEMVDSLNRSEKQDKCMVCLDEFVDNDQLRTLSCGHQYHVSCVDKWLKMNRTCPMCRSDAVVGSSSYLFVN